MKLSITKNIFRSFFFFFRHLFLFVLVNLFCEYFFMNFLYKILINLVGFNFDNYFDTELITTDLIIRIFLITLSLIVKILFYITAVNNDREDIENDIFMYFSEFFNNFFYLAVSFYAFLFLGLFSSLLILPGILVFTFCTFFPIYAVSRRKPDQKRYGQTECISRSFSLTKNNRAKLLFFNNIVRFACIYMFIMFNTPIYFGGYNINYLIKILFLDYFLIYNFNIGFDLEKIENENFSKVEQNEKQSMLKQIRAISNV